MDYEDVIQRTHNEKEVVEEEIGRLREELRQVMAGETTSYKENVQQQ